MNNKIKVVIADDTLIAREGLKKILMTEEDIDVVGEVGIVQDTLPQVRRLRPDVLVIDLRWFDDESAGASAIEQVKHEIAATKVVGITSYPDLVLKARKAGADAALPKGFSKAELIETIRVVHRIDGFPVPAEALAADQLSDREREVLMLMAKGLTDKQISDQLNISTSTAKNHAQNIISKLGATNRAQAVAMGFKRGLLKEHV
jgi:DNA-binding NarL/FixJ family response regulator